MAKKKKETMELRVYEIPAGHKVLALYGDAWVRTYGKEQKNLHFHNLCEIGICRYGKGELRTADSTYTYSDGTLTVFPANYPHITESEGEEKNFWEYLFFDPKVLINELYPESPVYAKEVLAAINAGAVILSGSEHQELVTLIDAVIRESGQKNRFHHMVIEHYMKIILIELMRLYKDVPYFADGPAKTSNAIQIGAAIDYIMDHLSEPIKAVDLANACNMSETHFRRIFDDYVDMSPMDYVNLCRIQKACDIMKKGTDPMDLVAEKCGFAGVSTFNRNFKKFLGITPYQWKIAPGNYEGMLNKYHISPRQGW